MTEETKYLITLQLIQKGTKAGEETLKRLAKQANEAGRI